VKSPVLGDQIKGQCRLLMPLLAQSHFIGYDQCSQCAGWEFEDTRDVGSATRTVGIRRVSDCRCAVLIPGSFPSSRCRIESVVSVRAGYAQKANERARILHQSVGAF
jgi:hypothetical protein